MKNHPMMHKLKFIKNYNNIYFFNFYIRKNKIINLKVKNKEN